MAWSPTRVSPEPCSVLTPGGTTPPETPPLTGGLPAPPYPPGPPDPPWGGRAPRPSADLSPRALSGGTANRGLIIRVGDTVVRPTAPCWRATHALLDHLAAAGFDGAPRVLAAGPVTETLTYIDGQAGVPPLTENALTDPAKPDPRRRHGIRRQVAGSGSPSRSSCSAAPHKSTRRSSCVTSS